MDWELITRLMQCFPHSLINYSGEFIAHEQSNTYFILSNCHNELDIKCKVLEWLSRAAYKTKPYMNEKKNKEFHEFMLSGINKFLGTQFTSEDMEQIYTYLGNACNHAKTVKFVESGYDMGILEGDKENAI